MLESSNFSFNGESSKNKGVRIGSPDGGLYKEIFLPTRKIVERSIPERNAPYLVRVEDEPLSFPLTIYIKDWKQRNSIRDIARWLFTDEYKPLYFESNPDRVFYAMFQGSSSLIHNGLKDGYITLNVRTNSPYSYSPLYNEILEIYNSETKQFFNYGDLSIRPRIIIYNRGTRGDVRIKNNQNNQEMIIRDVWENEVLTVDCDNEIITSNFEYNNRYLFDNHNDVWLDWDADSEVYFTFTGNFNIDFGYEYVYLQEWDLVEPRVGGSNCR